MKHGGARKGSGRPKGCGQFGEPTKPIRLPLSLIDPVLKFVKHKGYRLALFGSKVAAGSPSPADDHIEKQIDLNEHLIKCPETTFLVCVSGNSMIEAGIHDGDTLIVNRSLPAVLQGKIVVAAINGELTVKRFCKKNNKLFLLPENKEFAPIEVTENNEIYLWGIVTHVIRSF